MHVSLVRGDTGESRSGEGREEARQKEEIGGVGPEDKDRPAEGRAAESRGEDREQTQVRRPRHQREETKQLARPHQTRLRRGTKARTSKGT